MLCTSLACLPAGLLAGRLRDFATRLAALLAWLAENMAGLPGFVGYLILLVWLAGWQSGCFGLHLVWACCLVGVASCLAGLPGWLAGWLAGWLGLWLTGWLNGLAD
jgi:hypothetical protein